MLTQAASDRLGDSLREAPKELLLLLRAVNALENAPPDQLPRIRDEVHRLDAGSSGMSAMRELGLAEKLNADEVLLTPLGRQVCDGVKQYVNWLEHADQLPRGVMPGMIAGRRILDVGCGVGCAMLTFLRHGAARVAGIDMIESSLSLCRAFAQRECVEVPLLARADGAALPFADGSFDLVFSRLALNYMRTDAALADIARVCTDGATLVVCLNTLPWHLEQIWRQLRRLQLKAASFGLFTLFNGALFHTTGRQITLRHRGAMHSVHSPVFHTPRTLRRDLSRWGFDAVSDDSSQHPLTPTFHAIRRPRGSTHEPVAHGR